MTKEILGYLAPTCKCGGGGTSHIRKDKIKARAVQLDANETKLGTEYITADNYLSHGKNTTGATQRPRGGRMTIRCSYP